MTLRWMRFVAALALLGGGAASAGEFGSSFEAGPSGFSAESRLRGVGRGFGDVRLYGDRGFGRSTTVGWSKSGNLIVGIDYGVDAGDRTIAGHFSQTTTPEARIRNRAVVEAIGGDRRRVRVGGGFDTTGSAEHGFVEAAAEDGDEIEARAETEVERFRPFPSSFRRPR